MVINRPELNEYMTPACILGYLWKSDKVSENFWKSNKVSKVKSKKFTSFK